MMNDSATQTEQIPFMGKFLDLPLTSMDHVRAVTICVLFTFVCFSSKKSWVTADFFSCCFAGLGLFLFPRTFIGFQVRVIDKTFNIYVFNISETCIVGYSKLFSFLPNDFLKKFFKYFCVQLRA